MLHHAPQRRGVDPSDDKVSGFSPTKPGRRAVHDAEKEAEAHVSTSLRRARGGAREDVTCGGAIPRTHIRGANMRICLYLQTARRS